MNFTTYLYIIYNSISLYPIWIYVWNASTMPGNASNVTSCKPRWVPTGTAGPRRRRWWRRTVPRPRAACCAPRPAENSGKPGKLLQNLWVSYRLLRFFNGFQQLSLPKNTTFTICIFHNIFFSSSYFGEYNFFQNTFWFDRPLQTFVCCLWWLRVLPSDSKVVFWENRVWIIRLWTGYCGQNWKSWSHGTSEWQEMLRQANDVMSHDKRSIARREGPAPCVLLGHFLLGLSCSMVLVEEQWNMCNSERLNNQKPWQSLPEIRATQGHLHTSDAASCTSKLARWQPSNWQNMQLQSLSVP